MSTIQGKKKVCVAKSKVPVQHQPTYTLPKLTEKIKVPDATLELWKTTIPEGYNKPVRGWSVTRLGASPPTVSVFVGYNFYDTKGSLVSRDITDLALRALHTELRRMFEHYVELPYELHIGSTYVDVTAAPNRQLEIGVIPEAFPEHAAGLVVHIVRDYIMRAQPKLSDEVSIRLLS
jgi:hypothetical protein